jgi:hypothetical protein
LALGIATIGAMRVSLDKLPNGETIRSFGGRDGDVLAHDMRLLKDGTRFEKGFDAESAILATDA